MTEKKLKLDLLQPYPQELIQNLEAWIKTELTYSSNAIEGNTLSRIETAEVIRRGISAVVSGKPLKDQLEAINHAKAVDFIKKLAKERENHQFITEKDILDIHTIILAGINDDWAGKYRTAEIFIRGSNAEFPLPHAVPSAMKTFVQWLEGQQEEHPVKIAADAHYKFVTIHPFVDGNGRTTRLLMNLILLLNGYPMAIIRNEERTAYLQSFEIVRTQHTMHSFYDLVFSAVERSLDIYLQALERKQPVFKTIDTNAQSKFLKIGEVAKRTGETVHTIRYWTKEGLLKVSRYSKGGYQLYDLDTVTKAARIRKLQNTKRLTLAEIKKELTQ